MSLSTFPRRPLRRRLTGALVVLLLTACDGSPSPGPSAAPLLHQAQDAVADPVAQIAAGLQACAYDGAPVTIAASTGEAPGDCRDLVARIMRYTGLPQNFTVVEAPVPNAAAVILLDEARIPQRVIAFNREFLQIVHRASGGNAWAPVSIMAHEIGHHLSGHTITPGGSQPPTELEADKFSGFVLQKMGAPLDDAQIALSVLVPDGPGSTTHPGRSQRLAAVREGWLAACRQQGHPCDAVTASATPATSGSSAAATQTGASEKVPPDVPDGNPEPMRATRVADGADTLPAPGGTPAKFDRFIHDEFGLLDRSVRAEFERRFFEHASRHGVEIVTLLTRDLHGLDADAYALAMLRQLRVGKLDVGNGVVLVVAPEQSAVGVAMGPGVALQMEFHDTAAALRRWLDLAWPLCRRAGTCGQWSENLLLGADQIRRDTAHSPWTIRYTALADLLAASRAQLDGATTGEAGPEGPAESIVQFDAEVVDAAAHTDPSQPTLAPLVERGRQVLRVRSAEGTEALLYAPQGLATLLPAGPVHDGARYRFVARARSLSWNPRDVQHLDLLSYDAR